MPTHANSLSILLQDVTKLFDNINIDAGYPFQIGATTDNMRFAAEGENSEASIIYPDFAKVAANEGFERISHLFTLTAGVERGHNAAFTEIAQRLTDGTLYRREKPVVWKCANCGFERIGDAAWDTLPALLVWAGVGRTESGRAGIGRSFFVQTKRPWERISRVPWSF